MERWIALTLLTITWWLSAVDFAAAHHVLGRPAYSLNENSNTPPSLQAEVRIGDYLVTYMVFPAFPRPDKPGRISLYATRFDDGTPFRGEVVFKARADTWLSWLGIAGKPRILGTQPPDDNVYRQGYHFHDAGDYIISAEFEAGGEPYVLEFPLRIGDPAAIGPLGLAVGAVLIVLVSVSIIQRRRSMTGKIRGARENKEQSS